MKQGSLRVPSTSLPFVLVASVAACLQGCAVDAPDDDPDDVVSDEVKRQGERSTAAAPPEGWPAYCAKAPSARDPRFEAVKWLRWEDVAPRVRAVFVAKGVLYRESLAAHLRYIAEWESGDWTSAAKTTRHLNRCATNVNGDGSVDRGLFQINSSHLARGQDGASHYDLETNLSAAADVYLAQGLGSWASFRWLAENSLRACPSRLLVSTTQRTVNDGNPTLEAGACMKVGSELRRCDPETTSARGGNPWTVVASCGKGRVVAVR